MKNIAHYFSDFPKSADNSFTAMKEVKVECAKSDKTLEAVVAENEGIKKKKRNRVKIKISKTPNEGTFCDIVESMTDLIDKTPSPRCNPKKNQIVSENGRPNRNSYKSAPETNPLSQSGKKCKKKSKSKACKTLVNDNFSDSIANHGKRITPQKYENGHSEVMLDECARSKQIQIEKLIELSDKKEYSKRKAIEEDQTIEIEKQIKKKKKYLIEPNNKTEVMGNENSLKCTGIPPTKRSSNLLNYFSKVTPEQLEKARLLNAKVTVKAEVHIPINSPMPCSIDGKNIKRSMKKKTKSHIKHSEQEFDEIQVIQSETLVLSPNNEKVISPFEPNKPKWSLKIQLSQNNFSASEILNEDDIYTPTTLQKENIKLIDKIPKILLPLKNKKENLNNIPLEGIKSKSQESSLNSSCIDKIQEKYSKILDCPIPDQSKIKCANLNKNSGYGDYQIIENNFLKQKHKEKIAPLFEKKVKPNPQAIAAKRLFLQSDAHKNSNSNKNQSVPTAPIEFLFPTISHVNQYTNNNTLNHRYQFQMKNDGKFITNYNPLLIKTVILLDNVKDTLDNLYELKKTDVQTILSEIETYCPNVQALWKSILMLSKSENTSRRTPKIKKKLLERKSNKQTFDNFESEFFNSSWTDKYKPRTCAELIGNEEAALKLKTWLSSWKSFKNKEGYSSSEEFYTSDSSTSSSIENNQVAILIGPYGSGKTASVYAIAQELGYKVLEVNASSKRPGKKILKDFEEATKSHRVKKSNIKSTFTTIQKKNEEIKKISQNSLILMEDVDLVFEEDEGFISAAFQLASNTKRPIVMTLRDTCSYLSKLAPQQLQIDFQSVLSKRVSVLMQLITLSEKGCKLSQDCIDAISASGDLRKGILQLQYFLLSNSEQFSYISMAENCLTWKEMCTYIYKPLAKVEKEKNKIKDSNKNTNSYNIICQLNKNIDSFILMSDLLNTQDPLSYLFELKSEPSISLVENTNLYSNAKNTSSEVGKWLSDAIKKTVSKNAKKLTNQEDKSYLKLKTKNQINKVIDSALSQIASYTLDRRALAVDYLSSIRTVCRAEEIRNQINSKRGNRFFHYFQSSKVFSGSVRSSNIFSAACKILLEKSSAISET